MKIKMSFKLPPELENYISHFMDSEDRIVFGVEPNFFRLNRRDGYYTLLVNGKPIDRFITKKEEVFEEVLKVFNGDMKDEN